MSSSNSKSNGNKKFAVVSFDGSDEASVVPVTWLTREQLHCYWPDAVGSSLQKLVVNPNSVPQKSWKLHSARVLGKYKSLKSARQAEEKSLYTSAVESDSSGTPNEDLAGTTETRARTRSHRRQNVKEDSEERESEEEQEVIINQPITIPEQGLFQGEIPGTSSGIHAPAVVTPDDNLGSAPIFLESDLQEDQILIHYLPSNQSAEKKDACTQTAQKDSQLKFQELVVKKLADIQLTQERILAVVGQHATVDVEEFDSLPIPCDSKEDFESLEHYLESKDNQSKLERYLALIGGATLKKAVNSILKRILTDTFATIVSFSGRGNAQLAFEHFESVHQTVTRATRKHSSYHNSTSGEINSIIAEWLRLAKDRSTGRSHKKKVEA